MWRVAGSPAQFKLEDRVLQNRSRRDFLRPRDPCRESCSRLHCAKSPDMPTVIRATISMAASRLGPFIIVFMIL